jgi:hypothetical protein
VRLVASQLILSGLSYNARCLIIGLEVLSDRRIFVSALFARDILVGMVDCAGLAIMLRFEEFP